jgi:hypothetical protein
MNLTFNLPNQFGAGTKGPAQTTQTAPAEPDYPVFEDIANKYNIKPEPAGDDPTPAQVQKPADATVTKPEPVKPAKVDPMTIAEKYKILEDVEADPDEGDEPIEVEADTGEQKADVIEGGILESVASVAELLAEKEIIKTLPQGFDPENLTVDSFLELVQFTVEQEKASGYEAGIESLKGYFQETLDPTLLKAINFQLSKPNMGEDELHSYLDSLIYLGTVKDLDPAHEPDAEAIIRDYYQLKGDMSADDIIEEVNTLREKGTLVKEATRLQPRLTQAVERRQRETEERNRRIAEAEQASDNAFLEKVNKHLAQGKVYGVPIGDKEANFLRQAFSYKSAQIPVPGGKTVTGDYVSFLLKKHMQPDGDLDRVLMAALVLEGKADYFIDHFKNSAKTEEIKKMVTQKTARTFKAAGNNNNTPSSSQSAGKNPMLQNLFKTK